MNRRILVLGPVVLALVSAGLVCFLAMSTCKRKSDCPRADQAAQHDLMESSSTPCPLAASAESKAEVKPTSAKKPCATKKARTCSKGYPAQSLSIGRILGSALIAWYAVGLVVIMAMVMGRRRRKREDDR